MGKVRLGYKQGVTRLIGAYSMNYKGYYIWFAGNRWIIQVGYEVLGEYKTLASAKSKATRLYKQNLI